MNRFALSREQTLRLEELRAVLAEQLPADTAAIAAFPKAYSCDLCLATCMGACIDVCGSLCGGNCVAICAGDCNGGCTGACGGCATQCSGTCYAIGN